MSTKKDDNTPAGPSMPRPPELPTPPEAGTMSAREREKRIMRNLAKLARGMANTAPGRGDPLGPSWHELACDCEAMNVEAGNVEPAAPVTPHRPIELGPPPAVIPMAGPVQSSTDALLVALVDEVRKLGARS